MILVVGAGYLRLVSNGALAPGKVSAIQVCNGKCYHVLNLSLSDSQGFIYSTDHGDYCELGEKSASQAGTTHN